MKKLLKEPTVPKKYRETLRVSRLYFAHPRLTYGTKREKDMLNKIKHVFVNCEIINPGESKFQRKMEAIVDKMLSANEYIAPFLQIINKCDCLVFMSLITEKTGVGTYLETRHAEACEIPVYVWDGIRFTTNYRLDECHFRGGKLDYKDNWAVLTLGKSYAKGEVSLNTVEAEAHVERNRRKTEVRRRRVKLC